LLFPSKQHHIIGDVDFVICLTFYVDIPENILRRIPALLRRRWENEKRDLTAGFPSVARQSRAPLAAAMMPFASSRRGRRLHASLAQACPECLSSRRADALSTVR
jgi:hypothetical protein